MTARESNTDSTSVATARSRLVVTAIVLVALVYVATLAAMPHDGFWINDNGLKFIQTQSIISGEYRDYTIPWSGRDLDPDHVLAPFPEPFGHVLDGRIVAQYSPVFPLLSTFPFRLLGFAGLYLLPFIGGVFTLVGTARLTTLLTPSRGAETAGLAVILTGLATPLWFYSATFWEHTPAMALFVGTIERVVRYLRDGGRRRLATAAILCGLAVTFRDELYLAVAVFALALTYRGPRRWRDGVEFILVALVAILPLWIFQWAALGHPLGLHFATKGPLDDGFVTYLRDRWPVVRNVLLGAHGVPRLSFLVSLPALALFISHPQLSDARFRNGVGIVAVFGLVTGALALAGHVAAERPMNWLIRSNGLFAVTPVLLLAFLRTGDGGDGASAACATGRRFVWHVVLLLALLYIAIVPPLNSVGIHWGCRFLVVSYPPLAALAAVTISRAWPTRPARARAIQTLVITLVGLSVVMQLHGIRLLHERKTFFASLNREVLARPETTIVTTGWFVPQILARAYAERRIFLLPNAATQGPLFERLHREGTHTALMIAPAASSESSWGVVVDDHGLMTVRIESRSTARNLQP